MSYPIQQLQPFTLYMTISLPEDRPPHVISPIYDHDTTTLQILKDKAGAYVEGSGDFDWGVYWHRGRGDGTWYTYRFSHPGLYSGPPGFYKPWVYRRYDIKESPRLHHQVVGLIRVMRVPESVGPELTEYLDWLAERTSSKAMSDEAWAAAISLRTRKHVAKMRGVVDKGAEEFDATGLICQTLQFAYREV
ncbi:hypothetical protein F66182_11392 [Fusarium sp. NRRL 66182]|nr:hypothetical protein F66182_11392 [Fusarium sp. NRRL 66182]